MLALLEEDQVLENMSELLALIPNQSGPGIPIPNTLADYRHSELTGRSEQLTELLMTGETLYYMEHSTCMCQGSADV